MSPWVLSSRSERVVRPSTTVTTAYLGHRLVVGGTGVAVFAADGGPLCTVPSMATARRVVRFQRRMVRASA